MATNVQNTISHYEKYIKTRLACDPEYRAYLNQHNARYITNRRKTDEEFNAKCNEMDKKCKKNRYATDPSYREKKIADAKERYRKKKELEKAINEQVVN